MHPLNPTIERQFPALLRHYLTSTSSTPKLRVGLLVDSVRLAAWEREIVEHVRLSNFAELTVVIRNKEQAPATLGAPRWKRVLQVLLDSGRRSTLLFMRYNKWDRRRLSAMDNPLESCDCSDLLGSLPFIDVVPIRKNFVHRFTPEDVARGRQYDLDVLLRFGFNILRGDILKTPRYGIWSYHHGDNDQYRGCPAGFWEVYEDNPISGVLLQILTENLDAGIVLKKGLFSTVRGMWHLANIPRTYWGATHFVIEKLHDLHQFGWEHLKERLVPEHPYSGKKTIYRRPTNYELIKWLAPRVAKSIARKSFRPVMQNHWRLAIRAGSEPTIKLDGSQTDLNGFRWIDSPPGCFWADPFAIREKDQNWVFFEEYLYGPRRGRISCAPVSPTGHMGDHTTVLDQPYHLSYPHVFRHEGEYFMIPESCESHQVELYRATDFPYRWKLERNLFADDAVDTTVWRQDGKFWFFTSIAPVRGDGRFLYLFYSDSLTGSWTYHPSNPISVDVRRCRMGGAIFRRNGLLYRPSQDCSKNYGYGLGFNLIEELTPHRYRERPALDLGPEWRPKLAGMHSYAFCEGLEIIDGQTTLPKSGLLAR